MKLIPANGGDELFPLEKRQGAEALANHCGRPHFAGLGESKSEYVLDKNIKKEM